MAARKDAPPLVTQVATAYGSMLVPLYDTGETSRCLKAGLPPVDNEIIAALAEEITENGVMVDVGACIGVYTTALAHYAKRVIAFEPQRFLFNILCANCSLQSLDNVYLERAALGNRLGADPIALPRHDWATPFSFNSIELGGKQKEDLGVELAPDPYDYPLTCTTLDAYMSDGFFAHEFCAGLPVEVLKVDVEGMECDVIEGAGMVIMRHRPIIVVEWIKAGEETLRSLLNSFGYSVEAKIGLNLICRPLIPAP